MAREIIKYDVIIIGAGPAGLAAAEAVDEKYSVLLIEREARAGGILKQCIHDGFGLVRFKEKLSGPEYAERYIQMVFQKPNIKLETLTFVIKVEKIKDQYVVTTTSKLGIKTYAAKRLILANGCRERTARQVNIHGDRPAGVMTAGNAQNFVNLMGLMPTKRCVILGSGDIGLIMARRLKLEGADVIGVYEAKSTPSGLSRNIQQCLIDFDIPLHLSKTVTRVFGNRRVEEVEISSVDDKMNPIKGTEEYIKCDALIVSVGLIPENEIAESLDILIDKRTKGPFVDQNMMTLTDGIYSVGNALHVHDLVDYVSEVSEIAGKNIGSENKRELIEVGSKGCMYLVPQYIDINSLKEKTTFFFRASTDMLKAKVVVTVNGGEVFTKKYIALRPPEMEKISVPLKLEKGDQVEVLLFAENVEACPTSDK
ncbi:MAG TPA: FAD-dependent oxidoreductase [Clostridia bacterium]|jgi:thioredoxin reductase|nr:FAD-dependent oxidoreductase [Clostridia bacterium]